MQLPLINKSALIEKWFVLIAVMLILSTFTVGCEQRLLGSDELMYQAVLSGDVSKVKRLADEHPVSVNAIVEDVMLEDSMLHVAVHNQHYAIAKHLVKRGANVDATDFDGYTPLYYVIKQSNTDMIRFLLKNGSNINHQNKNGYTPLHAAAALDSPLIAEMLLNSGADPRIKDHNGETPLDYAVKMGRIATVQVIKLYVSK